MNKSLSKTSITETLLKTAWLSILLGLGMEILLLVVAASFKNSPSIQTIIADTVQKISWSSIVCMGVAVGTAAGKMRSQAMGLAGLIAAPVAFHVAKVLHKSTSQALSLAGPAAAGGPSPLLLAMLKGLEYAVLGFVLGQVEKNAGGIKKYVFSGFIVGIVFGGTIIYLTITMAAKPLPLVGIVSRCVNEFIFPIGCSLVLYTAQRLGEKHK